MTPLFLSIDGINSFLEKQEIDFTLLGGDNIFCIYGATGAGKTTILDAIILALYGAGDRVDTVAEYVNLQRTSAEIIFRFSFEGIIYEVKKTFKKKSGADKAFLYDLNQSLLIADGVERVNLKLKEILDLTRAEFTQVVVLEQGRFNRFLTAKKAERSRTVSQLFSLSQYDNIQSKFSDAVKSFENKIENLEAKTHHLKDFTKEFLSAKAEEKKALEKEIEASRKTGETLEKYLRQCGADRANFITVESAKKDLLAVETALKALNERAIALKDEESRILADENRYKTEKKNLTECEKILAVISAVKNERLNHELLEKEREGLRDTYKASKKTFDEINLKHENLTKEKADLNEKLSAVLHKAFTLNNSMQKISLENLRRTIQSEKDKIHKKDAAAHVSALLKKGDTCPVCGGTFEKASGEQNKNDEEIIKLLDEAAAIYEKTETLERNISEQVLKKARAEAELNAITEKGNIIKKQIDDYNARTEKELGGDYVVIEKQSLEKKSLSENFIAEYEKRKEKLAVLKQEFSSSDAALKEKQSNAVKTIERLKDVKFDEKEYAEKTALHESVLKGIDALLIKRTECESIIRQAEDGIKLKKELDKDKAALIKKRDNADMLYKLLRGNKFLEYVEEEYIQDFTLCASDILKTLSAGKYELKYLNDENNKPDFYVSDFLRGGEERKIRTLSGGETFLASLALAMAISEKISASKSFDFFFLDEGFGTLDENSIDIVADALFSLSRDVMVGVISHRSELVERIPVKAEVIAAIGGEGSRVRIVN